MYIYRTYRLDTRYIPPKEIEEKEWPTQTEAIEYLLNNGGGWYRDILSNVDCIIQAKEWYETKKGFDC